MEIRMIHTQKGSIDGIKVETYEAGKKYELPPSLAQVFLNEGWAKEEKVIDKVPEVKANGLEADNTTTDRTSDTGRSKKSSKSGSKR